jgi:polysaccharide deacetylase family protein (PEP-CTERM system associated)
MQTGRDFLAADRDVQPCLHGVPCRPALSDNNRRHTIRGGVSLPRGSAKPMIHAFTVDVEDYHNVMARDWLGRDGPPTRAVVDNTSRILGLMSEYGVRGTFFVLGEVAAAYPSLIRDIAAGGHEIGVHGFYHRQVFRLTPDSFRKEVADAKLLLEDLVGSPILGHRAPAFSIVPNTGWALDVLADVGFRYDSSIFPMAGRRYGWPGFRSDIHEIKVNGGRTLIEAPLSTVSILGKRLPACGGGYLRHFPGALTRWAVRRIGRNQPAIVYTHPYEIEWPTGPLDVSGLDAESARKARRFHQLQMRNRAGVEGKIVRMLREFKFEPLWDVIQRALSLPVRRAIA